MLSPRLQPRLSIAPSAPVGFSSSASLRIPPDRCLAASGSVTMRLRVPGGATRRLEAAAGSHSVPGSPLLTSRQCVNLSASMQSSAPSSPPSRQVSVATRGGQ